MTRAIGRRGARPVLWLPCASLLVLAAGCGEGRAEPAAVEVELTTAGTTPTVAASPDGTASYVAWVAPGADGADVLVARIDGAGGRIGDAVRVNDRPGDVDPHEQAPPQVRVGPDGVVYVLWQKKVAVDWLPFGASELRFSRSTDGGRTFSPAVTVAAEEGPPARRTFHDLAIAPDGSVYVSWIDAGKRDAARAAHAAAHGSGGSHHGHGHGAVAGEPGTEIRVARSTDGGATFGPHTVVDEGCCPCCRTSLAVAPDGTVYVAYRGIADGDVRDIVIARSTDGGRTFSVPRPVHDDSWVFPGCPHAGPSIAVDADGTVHAAWYTGREGHAGIRYAYSIDSAVGFSEPHQLAGGDWMPPSSVRLAAEGRSVWIAWDDRRVEEETRPVTLARVRGTNGRRVPGSVATFTGTSPDLALAGGAPTLVWKSGDAIRARIYGVD